MTYMTNGRILYGNIQRIVQVCKRGYLMVKYESYPDPWIVPNKRHGMPWVSCQVFGTHDRAGTLGWSVSVQTICGFPCLGMESNWQHQLWINQGRNEIRQTLLHLSNHSQSFFWRFCELLLMEIPSSAATIPRFGAKGTDFALALASLALALPLAFPWQKSAESP